MQQSEEKLEQKTIEAHQLQQSNLALIRDNERLTKLVGMLEVELTAKDEECLALKTETQSLGEEIAALRSLTATLAGICKDNAWDIKEEGSIPFSDSDPTKSGIQRATFQPQDLGK